MAKQTSISFWYWNIFWAFLFFSSLFYAQFFFRLGLSEESVRQCIRWSARFSVVLFSMAFAASSIHYFWKNVFTFWLRMNRRHLGITFGVSHLSHLGFLLVLQGKFHPVFDLAKTSSLIGGGMAYVFLVLMLLTSFPYFAEKISRQNWKTLHTVGGWWIWVIFFRSYAKRIFQADWGYLPLVAVLVLVFFFRLACFWKKRWAQAAARAA